MFVNDRTNGAQIGDPKWLGDIRESEILRHVGGTPCTISFTLCLIFKINKTAQYPLC